MSDQPDGGVPATGATSAQDLHVTPVVAAKVKVAVSEPAKDQATDDPEVVSDDVAAAALAVVADTESKLKAVDKPAHIAKTPPVKMAEPDTTPTEASSDESDIEPEVEPKLEADTEAASKLKTEPPEAKPASDDTSDDAKADAEPHDEPAPANRPDKAKTDAPADNVDPRSEPAVPVVTESIVVPSPHVEPLTQAEIEVALAEPKPEVKPEDAPAKPAEPEAPIVAPTPAPEPTPAQVESVPVPEPTPTDDAKPAATPATVGLPHHHGTMIAVIVALVVVAIAVAVAFFALNRDTAPTSGVTSSKSVSTADISSQAAKADESMTNLDTEMAKVNSGLAEQQGDLSE